MELLPIIIVLVVGVVGFGLMLAAFVMVILCGGWQPAMQATPEGQWPWPRRLMFAGALLGTLFGLLTVVLALIPGAVPWTR
ncbi:MAG TPA: hypothetical protein VNK04_24740 [Gemmataceae bacterium]|jgi:hypothetical protein|nr:hypothetical protein [Gemmataceae bacterium]